MDEALRNNLALGRARLAEERASADVKQARGLFFPSLTLESRYSEQYGALDFGDVVNPAYAALNELSGTDRFPTNLDLPFPLAHESRLRMSQPLFNESIRAGYAVARHRREAVRPGRLAAARGLAADVQMAYLGWLPPGARRISRWRVWCSWRRASASPGGSSRPRDAGRRVPRTCRTSRGRAGAAGGASGPRPHGAS